MKILFSMRHSGAIRNFEFALRQLADRGHEIHLSFLMKDKIGDDRMAVGEESIATRLARDCPNVSFGVLPKRSRALWFDFARAVRSVMDAFRYQLPVYGEAHSLRERAEERIPAIARWLVRVPLFRWAPLNRLATGALVLVDRAIPVDPAIETDVETHSPDLVLITPLVDLGSDQVDYVKAARRLGVPSALCVHSWDNLTNKGLIRIMPDRIHVWNEAQRREAVEHHGADPEDVVVAGAWTYDHWFEWEPSRDAEAFRREVGLASDDPYLLYLGSSRFIAPDEIDFIERWILALRRCGSPELREIGVLVRPHPENPQPWERLDAEELGDVAVWPANGANPVDREARVDYFDSIFHSTAIVGINTSGMIEAGIVGRPCFTILDPDNVGSQEGTLHFHHLVREGGGLLRVAEDFATHVEQLRDRIVDADPDPEAARQFVRSFVRPHGLETRGTDLLVSDIEQLGSGARPADRPGAFLLLVRALVLPAAASMRLVHKFARYRKKAQRGAGGGLLAWLWSAPRKFALKQALKVLRLKPVRSFINKYVIPRVLTGETIRPEMGLTEREVRTLAKGSEPIVMGPWLSEVGFEVLYWIPFLNWAVEYGDLDPERLVVVSRGGVSGWYETITDQYIDVLDYMTTEHYLYHNIRRVHGGKQKQRKPSEFDTEVLRLTKEVLKERDFSVLHPSTMYNLFMPYWKRQASIRLVDQFTEFRRHVAPDPSDRPPGLPDEYVAVRFYFNDSFPDTEDNRRFVQELLRSLTDDTDVVLLNPGFSMDEHQDLDPARQDRIHTIEQAMEPSNNLGVQTAVIAGARAFVGTYGGLSYVPPFYGVQSLAFYSDRRRFHGHHLEFANTVFLEMNEAPFLALDLRDAGAFGRLLSSGRWLDTVVPESRRRDRVSLA